MYESMILDWDGSFKQAVAFIWKEFWPYIIGFFVLYNIACYIKVKLENIERKRQRQRDQEDFERKVELYLKKKDEHEKAKKH